MNEPEQLRRIEALFNELVELSPEERRERLAECKVELRLKVERLLEADEAAGPFESRTPGLPTELMGEQIGDYSLVDKLGEGGMGVVYLAEHRGAIRRTAAVKIIKRGMGTERVIRRFANERQTLASMNHPNIAQVFEAGATEAGCPYFVMEHVPGLPINKYCDRYRLSIRDRLELFQEVCRAVQHAHHKGVIHRDLKPSNILVARDRGVHVPKIIDFGIAKVTGQSVIDQKDLTRLGEMVGTPEYMSPEQADLNVKDSDLRSDVYSLGVLLYELLSGTVPFDLKGAGMEELHRKIMYEAPRKPSARLAEMGHAALAVAERRRSGAKNLSKDLKGDLDWIVMKALEKKPADRYPTADSLSLDVDRHINHKAIDAGSQSAAYHIRKFVGRNRVAVSAAVIVFLSLVGALVGVNAGLQKARKEAVTAMEVERFLVDLFEVSDPGEARGNSVTAREILDRGVKSIEEGLDAEPEIQARLMYLMGEVYGKLGLYDVAQSVLNKSLRIRTDVLGSYHIDTLRSTRLLGVVLQYQNELDDAEVHTREAMEGLQRTLGEGHAETLEALDSMGTLLVRRGDFVAAVPYLEKALEGRRRLSGDDHQGTMASMNNLSAALSFQGKFEKAKRYALEALASARRVFGNDDPRTLSAINNVGYLLLAQGQLTAARPYYEESLESCLRVLGKGHLDTLISLNNMGFLLLKLGESREAEPFLRDALEGSRRILGSNHLLTLSSIKNMGLWFQEVGEFVAAEQHLREALEGRGRVLGAEHRHTLESLADLGDLYRTMGRIAEALSLMERALDDARRVLGSADKIIGAMLQEYGLCLQADGRLSEAEAAFLEAHAVLFEALGEAHPETKEIVRNIVEFYEQRNRPEDAAIWRVIPSSET